jgi:hypothetical protein
MNKYGIVNADNGQQFALVCADSMEHALVKFSKKMPRFAYKFTWIFARIGSAPYIVTDNGTKITAFEY